VSVQQVGWPVLGSSKEDQVVRRAPLVLDWLDQGLECGGAKRWVMQDLWAQKARAPRFWPMDEPSSAAEPSRGVARSTPKDRCASGCFGV